MSPISLIFPCVFGLLAGLLLPWLLALSLG
jgi:hypothetical protein